MAKNPKLPGNAVCPNCNKGADGYTQTEPDTKPKTGDVAICAYCGAIGLYEVDVDYVYIRRPSMDEMKVLLEQIPDLPKQVIAVMSRKKGYLEQNN